MLLAVIVFVSVFLIAALLIIAGGTGSSQRAKHTLARLNALLVTESVTTDDHVDIRKQELLSAIPFLNRLLLQLEIAPKLRRLLYQANVKWTPGGLLVLSPALWLLSSYLIYFKTGTLFFSLVLGLAPGALPFLYVLRKRAARFQKFEENLPAALDLMVNGLRAGHSLVSVMGMAADEAPDPIGPELRICFDEQNYGLELRTAV
jgi:tight adherence protein B